MSVSLAIDLSAVAVAAVAQALSGYLGWRVTVDGVREERQKRYEIVFVACAALGVLATVLTAYRGSNIAAELSGIDREISTLARHAEMVFVTFTSDEPELFVGKPAGFNVTYRNAGNATANNVAGFGRVFLVPNVKDETQRANIEKFQTEWALARDRVAKGTVPPGGMNLLTFTARGDRPITSADMDALKDGSEYLLIITSLEFEDQTGQHYFHTCHWIQAPAFAPLMLDYCVGFNEQN